MILALITILSYENAFVLVYNARLMVVHLFLFTIIGL